jgi:hypothetical protein
MEIKSAPISVKLNSSSGFVSSDSAPHTVMDSSSPQLSTSHYITPASPHAKSFVLLKVLFFCLSSYCRMTHKPAMFPSPCPEVSQPKLSTNFHPSYNTLVQPRAHLVTLQTNVVRQKEEKGALNTWRRKQQKESGGY